MLTQKIFDRPKLFELHTHTQKERERERERERDSVRERKKFKNCMELPRNDNLYRQTGQTVIDCSDRETDRQEDF